MRLLRSNFLVCLGEVERPSVVITSALAGEGKTATCGQLAWSLAYAGKRVIVLDLDFRHPTVHRALGGHNDFGVTDVILERRSLTESMQYLEVARTGGRGLYLLGTGPSVSNPTELLGSRRTGALIEALREEADIVLIDSPPVLPVTDALVISGLVDATLLVSVSGGTTRKEAARTAELLRQVDAPLIGSVLNGVRSDGSYGGYGYDDQYHQYEQAPKGKVGKRRPFARAAFGAAPLPVEK